MLHRIHNRLGTAGFAVAIIALIAALGGTALAALPGLNAKQKKEVKKIAKTFAKVGPQGAPGATGSAGAAGLGGKEGSQGLPGKSGQTGEAGACSLSLPECVLPPGATETGTWSFIARGEESFQAEVEGSKSSHTFGVEEGLISISFPLHLSSSPGFDWIPKEAASTSNCPGSYSEPEAAPGRLCLYVQHIENAGEFATHEPRLTGEYNKGGSMRYGFTAGFSLEAGKQGYGNGTWAVTAPCPINEGVEEDC